VWARADRPSRMLIEVATSDSFKDIRHTVFADALPESDFTAKALVEHLPAAQNVFYRVRFQDHSSPTIVGEPMVGRFRTAPADKRSVSFVWSGDTVGQGWGIDEARSGMRGYATMLRARPDFFLHSATRSMPMCRSRPSASCRTARCGGTSSPRRRARRPRRSPSFAATTNTICSVGMCARSMPRCRSWRSGTTTRSPTIGGRTSRSRAPSTGSGSTSRRMR
jgi:PhoD-like phosphatase